MALYNNLSIELINEILHNAVQSDLSSVCLCNRLLYSIAQPILYSDIKNLGRNKVPLFLRTIMLKPQLADTVRTIEFKTFSTWTLDEPSVTIVEPTFDLSFMSQSGLYRKIQDALGDKFKLHCDNWFHQILKGDTSGDFMVGFLVYLCSKKIEQVTLDFGALGTLVVAPYLMFMTARESEMGVDHDVNPRAEIVYESNEAPRNSTREAAKPFTLNIVSSTMRVEFVTDVHTPFFYFIGQLGRDMPNGLTKGITFTSFNRTVLPYLLPYFPSLEVFKLDFPPRALYSSIGEEGIFCPYSIAFQYGLRNSWDTLKELVLEADGDAISIGHELLPIHISSSGSPGLLAAFSQLQSLKIDASYLIGWTREVVAPHHVAYTIDQPEDISVYLPMSLEHLTVTEITPYLLDLLSQHFSGLDASWPRRLKTMKLVGNRSIGKVHRGLKWAPSPFVSWAIENGVVLEEGEWTPRPRVRGLFPVRAQSYRFWKLGLVGFDLMVPSAHAIMVAQKFVRWRGLNDVRNFFGFLDRVGSSEIIERGRDLQSVRITSSQLTDIGTFHFYHNSFC